MDDTTVNLGHLARSARRIVARFLVIGENRLALLTVEMQEERVRLLQALLLALGTAAFGMLAGVTLTALVVLLFRDSPLVVLTILTMLYGGAAGLLYARVAAMLRDWQTCSASLEQLRKDREGLEKFLA